MENYLEDYDKPIQEIVYSEMTKFKDGILYHGPFGEIFNPIMPGTISKKNIRYYSDPDNYDIYHCFCDIETNKLEDPSVHSIPIYTGRINEYARLLNPWLMKNFSIFDSEKNIPEHYFPKQINNCSIENGFINSVNNDGTIAIPFQNVDETTINQLNQQ